MRDQAIIFYDKFESYTSTIAVKSPWDQWVKLNLLRESDVWRHKQDLYCGFKGVMVTNDKPDFMKLACATRNQLIHHYRDWNI